MGLIGDKGYHAADESPDAKAQRAYQQHLHDNWDDCDMDPEDIELVSHSIIQHHYEILS